MSNKVMPTIADVMHHHISRLTVQDLTDLANTHPIPIVKELARSLAAAKAQPAEPAAAQSSKSTESTGNGTELAPAAAMELP